MSRIGRPSKYEERFCEMLIDHMTEGFTFESFAGRIGVNRDTIYEWAKVHEAFSDAKKDGRAAQQFFDEKEMAKIIQGKNPRGNITGLIFKMKNCHGWRDKVEQETKVNHSFQVEVKEFEENS
jgi:hypothetical protein